MCSRHRNVPVQVNLAVARRGGGGVKQGRANATQKEFYWEQTTFNHAQNAKVIPTSTLLNFT